MMLICTKQHLSEIWSLIHEKVNPFFPSAPFLYPLKTSEKLKILWCFQGVENGCIGNEWVKNTEAGLKKKVAYEKSLS